MSENDFECFANTGVNTPVTMFPNLHAVASNRLGGSHHFVTIRAFSLSIQGQPPLTSFLAAFSSRNFPFFELTTS